MRFLWLITTFLLTLSAVGGFMQQEPPLVVFVEDEELGTTSINNQSRDGLSIFANIFEDLGATTRIVAAGEPIPPEARLVVLIRSRQPLTPDYLAHLWAGVERGSNLLLALDPSGHAGSNADAPNSGIDRLLTWDYGVSLLNGVVIKPWFVAPFVSTLEGSMIETQASAIPHTITDPLVRYEIPVRMWGARPLTTELLAAMGGGTPLLTTVGFAETTATSLRQNDPTPLVLNYGSDPNGVLTLAAAAEYATGARAAVFGDSEMFQNGYGMAGSPRANPGNVLLAQRLAAWLLELPENTLPLLDDFTWQEIDGTSLGWTDAAALTLNPTNDTTIAPLNIRQVRAFRDQDYLHMLVDTQDIPDPNAQLILGFGDVTVRANPKRVSVQGTGGTEFTIPDARMAINEALEARLPLRIVGESGQITSVCLTSVVDTGVMDCMDTPAAVEALDMMSPSDLLLPESLHVTVNSTGGANWRTGPNLNTPSMELLRFGKVLAATGRNAAGDWIRVQTARGTGWIAEFLLDANGDMQALPVVDS